MPEWFLFSRLTGKQPADARVLTSCHRFRSSAGLRAGSAACFGLVPARSAICRHECVGDQTRGLVFLVSSGIIEAILGENVA